MDRGIETVTDAAELQAQRRQAKAIGRRALWATIVVMAGVIALP